MTEHPEEAERWRPLSVRESDTATDAYDALVPGVPDWLRPSLWEWVRGQVAYHNSARWWARRETVRELERAIRLEVGWDGDSGMTGVETVKAALYYDDERLLDAVDFLASRQTHRTQQGEATLVALLALLTEAGSAWTLAHREDRGWGLQRRVEATVEEAAQDVIRRGERPGQLLERAWGATYGRQPDPSDGYRQAVRAVEAAAIPVVLPKDRDATLGRVIGTMRSSAGQWQVSLSHRNEPELPVETLVSMMDLLWGSQHDRHVAPEDEAPLHVSQPEAEAALHLAVTLVQWFTSGAVTRR